LSVISSHSRFFDLDRTILDDNELLDYLPILRALGFFYVFGSSTGLVILGAMGLLNVPVLAALCFPGFFLIYMWSIRAKALAAPRSYYSRLIICCSWTTLAFIPICKEPVGTLMVFIQPTYIAEAFFFATPRLGIRLFLFVAGGTLLIRTAELLAGVNQMSLLGAGTMGVVLFTLALGFLVIWLLAYFVWQQKTKAAGDREVLDQAYQELRSLERSRSEFLSAVTHELKTPLVTVRGYIDLALRASADGGLRKGLQVARRSTLRLQRLIDELLISADPKSMPTQLKLEDVGLNDLLIEEMANFNNQAAAKEVTLIHVGEGPSDIIWADRERVGQVVSNLISNALRFSPPGSVIEVGSRPLAPHDMLVWVSDQGAGIPPEKLTHLFEEHYVRATESEGRRGMGLGLLICKRLVTAMGGRISVESSLIEGTTFSVTFPKRAKEIGAETERKTHRALVLDDETDVLALMEYHLTAAGYEAVLMQNGTAALEKAMQEDFDLLFLDVNVPGLTGVEVSRRLREAGRPGKILLFSALIRNDAERLIVESRADGFLPKPFDFDQIDMVLSAGRAKVKQN
jgi:signal transduction histidine kinase/CheY-like chemotaxis protein